jgi:multimeric flavodoxin WrbA
MKKVIAFNGSPRKKGNSSVMLQHFLDGVNDTSGIQEVFHANELHLEYCKGCLRCNLLGRCSNENDDWKNISAKILESDVVVFASPIYFHHLTASLKKIIDRFRSFVKVQITETGLKHTPWHEWNKDFVLLLSMGSSDEVDARPVIDLFEFMTEMLGKNNKLHIITATRLAIIGQLLKTQTELENLYTKFKLPEHLASSDASKNKKTLDHCYNLGKELML